MESNIKYQNSFTFVKALNILFKPEKANVFRQETNAFRQETNVSSQETNVSSQETNGSRQETNVFRQETNVSYQETIVFYPKTSHILLQVLEIQLVLLYKLSELRLN